MLGIFANAQTSDILTGKVKSTDTDVADVYIFNKTFLKSTITDAEGNFSIPARRNDTIVFTALKYKKKEIVVTVSLLESTFLTITLEEFVNELDEVTVRPYNLSGNLGSDVGTLKTEPVVTAQTLGLPNANAKTFTQSERLLKEASFGPFSVGTLTSVPFNPLINAITGRTKMLKKRVATDKKYRRTLRIQQLYKDSVFVKDFKIPMDRINDFMYFCEVDDTFAAIADGKDELRIWEFLKSKSDVYRKNNKLD
ncbi:carboxypeptidase-like regulatory domain-containing protein [Costertonia aggregata]|nr:carboxypeptidase-like regulatory domain-containing protein [Costertonia aggregata]